MSKPILFLLFLKIMVTKNEFIGKVAVDAGFSQDAVKKVFDSIEKLLIQNLSYWEKVKLGNVWIFFVSKIPERKGHNPKSGLSMMIPAHNRLKFATSLNTKEAINS